MADKLNKRNVIVTQKFEMAKNPVVKRLSD